MTKCHLVALEVVSWESRNALPHGLVKYSSETTNCVCCSCCNDVLWSVVNNCDCVLSHCRLICTEMRGTKANITNSNVSSENVIVQRQIR